MVDYSHYDPKTGEAIREGWRNEMAFALEPVFTVIFVLECLIKLTAVGFYSKDNGRAYIKVRQTRKLYGGDILPMLFSCMPVGPMELARLHCRSHISSQCSTWRAVCVRVASSEGSAAASCSVAISYHEEPSRHSASQLWTP